MKRVIEIILCVFVGIFLFGIIAMGFQVIGGDSPNKATIIGGLLSMIGGAIGALGAYMVATNQMKKQFEKQDRDRSVEYQIEKLDEALELAFEFKKILISCHEIKRNILLYSRKTSRDDHYFNLVEKIKAQIETLDLMHEMFDKYEIFFITPIDLRDIGSKVLYFKWDMADLIKCIDGEELSFGLTHIDHEDQQKKYKELSESIASFIKSLKEDIQNLIILK